MKKRVISIALCMMIVLSLSCIASASNQAKATRATGTWVSDSVNVPGTNGSGYSTVASVKATVTKTASFKATSKSHNKNFDARLVNSNNQSRSDWARNLPLNTVVHANEPSTITVGYEYRCQISSDFFTTGDTLVGISFSADNVG